MTDFPKQYISVAICLPVFSAFTYEVPPHLQELIQPAKRVLVPFGKRKITGFILSSFSEDPEIPTKSIIDILDEEPLFPPEMLELFYWIAGYYMYPLGEVIQTALPKGLLVSDTYAVLLTPKGEKSLLKDASTPFKNILKAIQKKPGLSVKALTAVSKCSNGDILLAEKEGFLVRKRILLPQKNRPRMGLFVQPKTIVSKNKNLSESRKRILSALQKSNPLPLSELIKKTKTTSQTIHRMVKDDFITIFESRIYRNAFGETIARDTPPSLTDEQKEVLNTLLPQIKKGFFPFLLQGVTASGKTEVYLQLAKKTLSQNKTVLVLVPEIALISQVETRFRARFGDQIAVYHSALSDGQRLDQWHQIASGQIPIVIGTRSAIFTPLKNIGIVIVDEEHDNSYKQEDRLRYNARDVALVRGRQANAMVVLGSATPSLQSIFNVKTGKLTHLFLHKRIGNRPLPIIQLVNLTDFKDETGFQKWMTPVLTKAIGETLQNKEQALLFLNRRGYSTFPLCEACGQPVTCQNCKITLTYHQSKNRFECHYCGFIRPAITKCPTCKSPHIRQLGFGTERVEELVKKLFPTARVARLDADTTAPKGALIKILKNLREGKTDILIGTQIVAKGHDFPNITLVGVLCADFSLHLPDFRSTEQTFQLISQVAGRAGRGDNPGKVILQTYVPDHFSMISAMTQTTNSFYEKELESRRELGYPPYSRMAQIRLWGKNNDQTKKRALELARIARELCDQPPFYPKIKILGPKEASLHKIANQYRWQLLFKASSSVLLHNFIESLLMNHPTAQKDRKVRLAVDIDPYFLL